MDLAGRFRRQAADCAAMGSPLYASLLEAAARDLESGGAVAAVMAGNEGAPGSVPSLRFAGALHRLVLEGRAAELAAYFPSVGGTPGPGAVDAMLGVVGRSVAELRELVTRPVQTNEVARVPVLLGGVREIARFAGRPLRLLEIGASGGLLLALLDHPAIASRRGCDRRPVDVTSEDGRLTLTSYVWADQVERLARLRAAIDVAVRRPVAVDAADAPEWLAERLAEPSGDAVPVVMHSVVMQYLSDDARADVERLSAGVWRLAFEPDEEAGDFALTVFPPGGDSRVIARAGGHGGHVRWTG